MSAIEDFFREIDNDWKWPADNKVTLHIIGSTALMLQTNYQRGTKDSDVFQTSDLATDTKQRLLELAGHGTAIHTRRRFYIDVVSNGLPFLPQKPDWIPLTELTYQE